MHAAYLERSTRFAFGLLAAYLLLSALLALTPGLPADLSHSLMTRRPVAELVGEVLPFTLKLLAVSLAYALPLALLLGVPAGLRPHSPLDRLLQAPALALMGAPAFAVGLLAIRSLALGGRAMPIQEAGQVGLVLLLAAWLSRAIRRGLTDCRSHGASLPRGRAALAALGRILQQTGSLLTLTMLVELVSSRPGIWRLVTQAVMARDMPVVHRSLWVIALLVLVGHLLGDLLVTAAVREEERPAGRISRSWLLLGGLLTLLLLVTPFLGGGGLQEVNPINRMLAPGAEYPLGTDHLGRDLAARIGQGARTSLLIAGVATGLAVLPAGLLATVGWAGGRWGQAILTPRTAVPNLFGPVLAGLVGAMLFRPSVLTLILALGLASIPAMLLAFRQLYQPGRTVAPWNRALPGIFGVMALVLAQNLLAEMTLGFIGLGVMPPTASLGGLLAEAAPYLRMAPHLLYPAVPAAAGAAGLFLIGHSLTGPAPESL